MGYRFVTMKPLRRSIFLLLGVLSLASCGAQPQVSSEQSSEEISILSSEQSSELSSEQPSSKSTEEISSSDPSIVSTEESVISESSTPSSEPSIPSSSSESEPSQSSSSSSPVVDPFGWKVNFNEYGKTFQKTLASLITAMNPKTAPYNGSSSDCLHVGAKAAAYPNETSSTFIPFYHEPVSSQTTTIGNCNREHTWPKSRGGNKIENDPLLIRPTLTKDNSSRGNYFYGIGAQQWDPAVCGYEGARGESARIILYAATRYASLGLSLSNNPGDATSEKTMGTLSKLVEWNNQYPPTDFERTVNERYYKMGFARNPFVDCPEYVNYIYTTSGYRTSSYTPDNGEEMAITIPSEPSRLDCLTTYIVSSKKTPSSIRQAA